MAEAVLRGAACFGNDQPLVTMIRALALGLSYRSASVLAAMQAASVQREPWRDAPPDLSGRELEMVMLRVMVLVQGVGDREIAEQLKIIQETARSRARPCAASSVPAAGRWWWPARALQLGVVRLGGC